LDLVDTGTFSLNNGFDLETAPKLEEFDHVMHVFHKEWLGIRAAAASLPGHKLAIAAYSRLLEPDITAVSCAIRNIGASKIVFHGFSPNADKILERVKDLEIFVVWHGNSAQLASNNESLLFNLLYKRCQRGEVRRAHMLKANASVIFPNPYIPMLLNRVPLTKMRREKPPFSNPPYVALVPAAMDVRKNNYASMIASCMSSEIGSVFHYCALTFKHASFETKTKKIDYRGREQHFRLLNEVDLCVNATVVDCHPMVDLEAIANQVMCISGPLNLDCLHEHPYLRAVSVSNPYDFTEICRRISYVASIPAAEAAGIIDDFGKCVNGISLERYSEFLDL